MQRGEEPTPEAINAIFEGKAYTLPEIAMALSDLESQGHLAR
jgi:hypothetical protein